MTRLITAPGGRRLNYLRLSVTDLCNLRCFYCMPPEGVAKLGHTDILSYEEMLRLIKIAAGLGMSKLRLTGGEPLVRRGLTGFLKKLHDAKIIADMRLTTNGVLLAPMAEELKNCGVKGLNISLDAVDAAIYAQMTGQNKENGQKMAKLAWAGFTAALQCGFETKVNCVPLRGINESQLIPLARLAAEYPVEVRFIEHMPIGPSGIWNPERFLSSAEIKNRLSEEMGELSPLPVSDPSAPARRFSFPGAKGSLGFISPLSGHFCGSCNRLRLTADGRLKPCLLTGKEIKLREPMRSGLSDEKLADLFLAAAGEKPLCHLDNDEPAGPEKRGMSRIGG